LVTAMVLQGGRVGCDVGVDGIGVGARVGAVMMPVLVLVLVSMQMTELGMLVTVSVVDDVGYGVGERGGSAWGCL
jgi:hypothetical protein